MVFNPALDPPWIRTVIRTLAVCCTAIVCAPGVSGGQTETSEIAIRGSKNLQPFVATWIEAYRPSNGAPSFDLQAVGTSEGIADLLAGNAEIAMASRSMTDDERLAAATAGLEIRETVVARMGIAVIVNSANTIETLTVGDLASIFAGEAGNWRAFGGPDQPISVIRKTSGWSPAFFQERIMEGTEYSEDATAVDSKEEVVAEVASLPWSIGFTGMPEAIPALGRVNLIRIVSDTFGDDATYALSRPLFFYTVEGNSAAAQFIDFVLGSEAQAMISDAGFFPADQTDSVAN